MHILSAVVCVITALVATTQAFTNPIKSRDGSDPHMVYSDGYYYLTSTTWTNIQLTRATTIAGLKTATPKIVYSDTNAARCCKFWAPEIHFNFGKWHIYYSAGSANTYDDQRPQVIVGSSSNIWNSTWSYLGRIQTPDRGNVWAIDGTVYYAANATYFIYSSFLDDLQSLYIARMNSAYQIGNSTLISSPTYSWEITELKVNEGPTMLIRNGRTFLVYSAAYCGGAGYKLGYLELTSGANPLLKASWVKNPNPIFVSGNNVWQPGHNAFFKSPSGAFWNVYHANYQTPGSCDGSRYTAVQPVNWNSNGTPNLGTPIALGQEIPEPV